MNVVSKLQRAARRIKQDAMTVYFVARDSRTPFFVRVLALAIAAYALSPIDLIPDFIPIVGYLDDVILLPLGIVLVIKLTPAEVIEESRKRARAAAAKPVSNAAAVVIVAIWLASAAALGYWLWHKGRGLYFG